MVVILRANDMQTDPRVQKYINALDETCTSYFLVGWDREGNNPPVENAIFYKRKNGYNLGKKAVVGRLLFAGFLFRALMKNKDKYKTIHACDFDTVLPALLIGLLFKKKVIFDIFDWFSDTIETGIKVLDTLIRIFERYAAKKADYIILCEEERRRQIGIQHNTVLILPNIPVTSNDFKFSDNMHYSNEGKLVVSYVGGFYYDRNIDILLNVCSKNENVILEIAGYGDTNIEKMAKALSASPNIRFHGKVSYEYGLEVMRRSNLIYAMYCKTNKNHIYAAPNKYYESLLLGVPIITTEGIILAEKVKTYDTGYVIGEEQEDLVKLFSSLDLYELEKKSNNCKKLWSSRYCCFVDIFMANTYIPLIKSF